MAHALVERGFGLELVEREACLVLYRDLNTELDAQQALWTQRDIDFKSEIGHGPYEVTLEYVADENFNYGHRPSLIENPAKPNYPNVATMAYESNPIPQPIDQGTNTRISLDVEIMVKSEIDELEVNRRIHRTLEAVHQVFMRNQNLNGVIMGFDNDPNVIITNVFLKPDEGSVWYWQAGRLRYSVTRHTTYPDQF